MDDATCFCIFRCDKIQVRFFLPGKIKRNETNCLQWKLFKKQITFLFVSQLHSYGHLLENLRPKIVSYVKKFFFEFSLFQNCEQLILKRLWARIVPRLALFNRFHFEFFRTNRFFDKDPSGNERVLAFVSIVSQAILQGERNNSNNFTIPNKLRKNTCRHKTPDCLT